MSTDPRIEDIRRRDRHLRRYLNRRKANSYRPEDLPQSMRPGGRNAVPTNDERSEVELWDWAQEPKRKGGPGRWFAYLSGGPGAYVVTNFTGAVLARVVAIAFRKTSGRWLSNTAGTLRAIGANGVHYVGSHNGTGVYVRLRPAKRNGRPIIDPLQGTPSTTG